MTVSRRTVAAVTLLVSVVLATPGLPRASRASVLEHPGARQLSEVSRLLARHYVRAIAPESLQAAALAAFDGTLDPYSTWLDSASAATFEHAIAGTFGGVGVQLGFDSVTASIRVMGLVRDAAAFRAGVQVGDTVDAVDGRPAHGHSLDEVAGVLRGRTGTRVHLRVRRPGTAAGIVWTLRRAPVELPTVRGLRLAGDEAARYLVDAPSRTGYVRVEHFSRKTAGELDEALAAVSRAGATSLVLDLRDDGGGLLQGACDAADRFLDSGTIVTVKSRGKPDGVVRAHPGVATRLPMAVLVNAYTASAAEVLAASLQDNGRAVVIGSRSYGKAVVLDLFHLRETPGLLKLATRYDVRPSGRPVERHLRGLGTEAAGVWPDSGLTVTPAEGDVERWRDANDRTTARMGMIVTAADSLPLPPDGVLERAVQVLAGARSGMNEHPDTHTHGR